MKTLCVELKANNRGADYSCKIYSKCASIESLKNIKQAIDLYLDMKISEAEQEVEK